jgi:predicted Zn-dependent protease with MMP-like domain
MSRREFERVVDATLAELPEWVVERIDNLRVVVQEWPTAEQDPEDTGLLGLYDGVSLAERGIDYFGVAPDTITVFRGPHLQLGLSRAELRREIRATVLHEIAHHLGIDDDRLHELGWD